MSKISVILKNGWADLFHLLVVELECARSVIK